MFCRLLMLIFHAILSYQCSQVIARAIVALRSVFFLFYCVPGEYRYVWLQVKQVNKIHAYPICIKHCLLAPTQFQEHFAFITYHLGTQRHILLRVLFNISVPSKMEKLEVPMDSCRWDDVIRIGSILSDICFLLEDYCRTICFKFGFPKQCTSSCYTSGNY